MTYKSTLTTACMLLLLLAGCISGRGRRVRNANQSASVSLADDIRTIFQISDDSEADKEALKQLFQRRPHLAALAAQAASDPENPEPKRRLADAFLEGQLYRQAFRLYEELRSVHVLAGAAEFGLAQVWHHWDDQVVALKYAESAVERDPNMTAGWDLMGRIHLRAKRPGDALSAWEKASRLEPGNAVLLSNIGYLLLLAGDWDNARVYLERAVGINSTLVEAQNNLGIALARSGDSAGALRHFMSVNAPAAAHNNLGVVLLAEGRKSEAVEQFSQAVQLDPAYAIARKNLAETQAAVVLSAIVELDPLENSTDVRPLESELMIAANPEFSDEPIQPSLPATIVHRFHDPHTTAWTAVRPAKPPVVTKRISTEPSHDLRIADQNPWGIGLYWLILLAVVVGLAGARELAKACMAGRQEWGHLKRFASFATVAGILVVIASGLAPRL